MPSIMLVVFMVQLIIHLINTVGAKAINDILWQISEHVPLLPSSQRAAEVRRLRRDAVRLKRDMNAISAQDDFAKWAKVRREHDKVLAEHDKKAALLNTSRSSFDTRVTVVRWLATTGLRFGLQFWHAKTPMFTLPRGWLPWYVEFVLGFPRCPYGGVSINMWSTACGIVISVVSDGVVWLLTPGADARSKAEMKQKEKIPTPVGVRQAPKSS